MSSRVALVTGGTSGIGQGIARVLLGEGYSVMATGLTDDELAQAKKDLPGDFDAACWMCGTENHARTPSRQPSNASANSMCSSRTRASILRPSLMS